MDGNKIVETLKQSIATRVMSRIDVSYLSTVCKECNKVVIAGNSLNKEAPHDIDVYPYVSDGETPDPTKNYFYVDGQAHCVLNRSPNAVTVKQGNTTYQFCSYIKPFRSLICSFDFAHVQVGAVVDLAEGKVCDVFFTDLYVEYLLTGKTSFTGSEFPLSSMLRAGKYRKYGILSSSAYKISVLAALADVVERGFKDYDDFKKQMDAIDMHELNEDERYAANRMYAAFRKRGLVRDTRN